MDNAEDSTAPSNETAPEESMGGPAKSKRKFPVLVSVAIVLVAAAGGWFAMSLIFPQTSSSDVATAAVTEMKKVTTFPQTVDEVTTLDDVTSEESAVHYHYTIAGADMSAVTEQAIADGVLPQLCSNKDTKALLERGVTMQYSYAVKETGESYELAFTKADC